MNSVDTKSTRKGILMKEMNYHNIIEIIYFITFLIALSFWLCFNNVWVSLGHGVWLWQGLKNSRHHVIIVTAQSKELGFWGFWFFRLGLTLESGFGASWDRGLGTWTRAWQFVQSGLLYTDEGNFCQGQVQSPKVKTKRTWALTQKSHLTSNHEGVLWKKGANGKSGSEWPPQLTKPKKFTRWTARSRTCSCSIRSSSMNPNF